MKYSLTVLVCLFEKNIETSETLKSLLAVKFAEQLNLLVCDNSPSRISQEDYNTLKCTFNTFAYKHTPENLPLSVLYNRAIDQQKYVDGYLMLCDDDSKIPINFFETLYLAISNHRDIKLFLPKVISGTEIVSPAKTYIIKSSFFKVLKPGIMSSRYITAINSCMVISNKFFKEGFCYDERLNFYGTDNYFMLKYGEKEGKLVVINQIIYHNLSFNSRDIQTKVKIFAEYKRAARIVYSRNLFEKLLVGVNNLVVGIAFSLRYRTIKFLNV